MIIEDYYARLDGPRPLDGLELVEPDVAFLFALPGHEVSGTDRDDLKAYIEGRPPVGRKHQVLRRSRDGDLEMVYGIVTEGDGRGTGSFSAVALLSSDRRVARYQAFFHPTFALFPLPAGGAV
ncbi:nuclear transport factor 2 family protein [Prauserella cavernicola]|uniref:Nuclear transport factor 2 family protein n=1 Tax=Prauserella cavernicola TaxID=2800127 RepID=A0A934V3M0_9PSEU|nr:nuclear transport factor 2 family protein [Prauserella cavernicola]MBK1787421.1 nuclear transport factor 2 family protein [Prauserella cavernicola]